MLMFQTGWYSSANTNICSPNRCKYVFACLSRYSIYAVSTCEVLGRAWGLQPHKGPAISWMQFGGFPRGKLLFQTNTKRWKLQKELQALSPWQSKSQLAATRNVCQTWGPAMRSKGSCRVSRGWHERKRERQSGANGKGHQRCLQILRKAEPSVRSGLQLVERQHSSFR